MFGNYGYYMTTSFNYAIVMVVAAVLAVLAGCILFFTFLRKENEGRFVGFKGKLFNLLAFNKFYTEKIVEFVYIIAAAVVTVLGVVSAVMGSLGTGIILLVAGNIVLRVAAELILMFIIFCKKAVSVDRRLAQIEAYLEEGEREDMTGEFEELIDIDCEFDYTGCQGCDGYSCCSAAADAVCSQCENWSDEAGGCTCPDDCETCDKEFVDDEEM